MREYEGSAIRNIAVVGHGGSGKTTLVDALAFLSGSVRRHGTIADGSTLTDTTPEEIDGGHSISLTCGHAEWLGTKINLLDTPGFLDFQGDAIAGLAAADVALCAIASPAGVEAGTERMYREAVARGAPVLFVVTMMDRERADVGAICAQIRRQLGAPVIPVSVPVGDGPAFCGVASLFEWPCEGFERETRSGPCRDATLPAATRVALEHARTELIEAIATTDEELMERYLDGGEIGRETALDAMRRAVARRELCPLVCVSAMGGHGVRALLSTIVDLMPSARAMEELQNRVGVEATTTIPLRADDAAPFAALVLKTRTEPHVGEVTLFRVLSGCVASGDDVFNPSRVATEKLHHLSIPQGRDRIEIGHVHAGDIGCVARLRHTHTNDTLSTRAHPVQVPEIRFPEPLVEMAIVASNRADEEKLQAALHWLHEEDPTLCARYNAETHETILSGMGERHLDVALARLRRRSGVAASLSRPRIAYRETIRLPAEGQGRHRKQSGGRGQFGDCWVRITPSDRGHGFRFHDHIVGGAIPGKFIPAVERGIHEAAERGVLAGFPLVDFEVELFDGSYHSVDSNELSFRMAGIQAFRTVAPRCRPVLLEPLDEVDIVTPDESLGDVLGDLSARRGHILGTEAAGDAPGTRVRAVVPQSELFLYASALQSMTHGRAHFHRHFSGYEEMPADAAQRVVAEVNQAQGPHD